MTGSHGVYGMVTAAAEPSQALIDEALTVASQWLANNTGWHSSVTLMVALHLDPGGCVLHGQATDLLAAIAARRTPISGAHLFIQKVAPSDDLDFCLQFENVTAALGARNPGLRCLALGNQINAVGLLKRLRAACPDLETVPVMLSLCLIDEVYMKGEGPHKTAENCERLFGIDVGSYPPADDLYASALMWGALRCSKLHMPLSTVTVDAWAAVLAGRPGIRDIGFSTVVRPVPSIEDSDDIDEANEGDRKQYTALRAKVEEVYAELAVYQTEMFMLNGDNDDEELAESGDDLQPTDMSLYIPRQCLAKCLILPKVFTYKDDFEAGANVAPDTWPNLRTLVINHCYGAMCTAGEVSLLNSIGAQLTELTVTNAYLSLRPEDEEAAVDALVAAVSAGSIRKLRLFLMHGYVYYVGDAWDDAARLVKRVAAVPTLRVLELAGTVRELVSNSLHRLQLARDGLEIRLVSDAEFERGEGGLVWLVEGSASSSASGSKARLEEGSGSKARLEAGSEEDDLSDSFDVNSFLALDGYDS